MSNTHPPEMIEKINTGDKEYILICKKCDKEIGWQTRHCFHIKDKICKRKKK